MQKSWYAVLTAEVLYHQSLNPRQKILVAVIGNMANEKGYCFATNKHFSEMMNCSTATVKRDLALLEEHNLIGRVIHFNNKGQVDYRALTPMNLPQVTDEPTPRLTDEPYNNKDSFNKKSNIDYNSFLVDFNKMTKKNTRIIPEKAKRQIKARLKEGYTKTEIFHALKNAINSEHHQSSNLKYLTLEFISRSDKLDLYLNMKPQKSQSQGFQFTPPIDE